MLVGVRERDAAEWEALARREPYFSLLDSNGACDSAGSSVPSAAYFQSGEEDVATLLAALTALLSREIPLRRVLDFGCGAGRLTLPLARRAERVVACDIAATMLAHVRRNAANAGLRNVTTLSSDAVLELPPGSFDFVCTLLVFQHIATSTGTLLFRKLIELLIPGGIAAVQVPIMPARLLLARLMASRGEAERQSGLATGFPISRYSLARLARHVEEAGARIIARLESDIGGNPGAVLVIEKDVP